MARYTEGIKRAAMQAARERGVFNAEITWQVPAGTIRRWLRENPVRRAAGAMPPAPPPLPQPNIGKLDAAAFVYRLQTYPSCCGALLAFSFGWPRGRKLSPDGAKAIKELLEAHRLTLFGITNSNQEHVAAIMRRVGWVEQMNFGGNYNRNRLRSWIYVPDERKIKQPDKE